MMEDPTSLTCVRSASVWDEVAANYVKHCCFTNTLCTCKERLWRTVEVQCIEYHFITELCMYNVI